MLALRAAARTTRALPRLAMPSSTSSTSSVLLQSLSAARASYRAPVLSSSYLPRLAYSPFSTSSVVRAQATSGEIDPELSAKLQSELSFEDEMAEQDQLPASIKDFLANSPFKVADVQGKQEVKLERTFGDEKITVSFSVSETPYDENYNEDEAFGDEEDGVETVNSRSSESERNNSSVAEGEEAEGEEEDVPGAAPPVHFTVTIEKPSKTKAVLSAECTAQDGEIVVDYVNHYPDAALAFASDPAASHGRVDRYAGPSFVTLDEDLQVLVENYLEERGITQGLAVFIPDYVDFKEQKEYMRWLKDVKDFVDA